MNLQIIDLVKKHRKSIMGFSALWILFLHCWYPFMPEKYLYLQMIERFVLGSGYTGVDIFLLLSGFGLVYSISKNSLLKFYTNRLRRVFIPSLITAIVYSQVYEWKLSFFLRSFFGINFYSASIYCFLWFIIAIETLYILFPAYYYLFSKFKNKILFTAFVLLIWFALVKFYEFDIREDMFTFINRIPVFVIGILLGYLDQQKKIKFKFTLFSIIILLVVLAVGSYEIHLCNDYHHYLFVRNSSNFLPTLLIAISLVPLLSLALDYLPKVDDMLAFFGGMSLEMYCCQEIMNDQIRPILDKVLGNPVIKDVIVIFVIVTVTIIFSKIIALILNKITKKKTAIIN